MSVSKEKMGFWTSFKDFAQGKRDLKGNEGIYEGS